MTAITTLQAREILDSRGIPTIEVDVHLSDGSFARAAAPSGASRGKLEASELRDGDQLRYNGRGVRRAVETVQTLVAPAIVGLELQGPWTLDRRLIELDGTSDRSRLGANTLLAISVAVTRALARGEHLYEYLAVNRHPHRLPVPMFNILNGGAHATNTEDIQEFMIAPVGASSFSEALRMGVETYGALRSLLKKSGRVTSVGEEGGFAPDLDAHTQPLDLLLEAIQLAGLRPRDDIVIAVDVAASELYAEGSYVFRKSLRRRRSSEQLIQLYASWLKHYPLWSIEDGLADTDTEGWRALTAMLGDRTQLVGDDLFVTNVNLLREAIGQGLANAVLIKLNQVGTVSETLETIAEALRNDYGVIISHRAGETDCDFIAHLAVATNAGQIKAGAPVRGERVAKYNQLLRIEEALGSSARYAGRDFVRCGGFARDTSQRATPREPQRGKPASDTGVRGRSTRAGNLGL